MRVSKKAIEYLKGVFLMRDWNITVKRSMKRSENFGITEVVNKHRSAAITVYPREIQAMKGKPEERTTRSTLYHEMAETAIASHEKDLPDWKDDPKFIDFCDDVTEHWAQTLMAQTEGREGF